MFVKCSIGGPARDKPSPARSLRTSVGPHSLLEMLAQIDATAARLFSLSMPHRKHGLKTRVAFCACGRFRGGLSVL